MDTLVVRRGLDKRHTHRRLAALAAASLDAAVTPKLGHDLRHATAVSENGQIIIR